MVNIYFLAEKDKEDSSDKKQNEDEAGQDEGLDKIKEEEEGDGEDIGEIEQSVVTESEEALPVITADHYNQYVYSLIKVIVGERTYTDWLQKGKLYFFKIKYKDLK